MAGMTRFDPPVSRRTLLQLAALSSVALPGQSVFAQQTRGITMTEVTEDRLAIVIGNAAYRFSPLDNPVNDARLIGGLLDKAGFRVFRYENLDRTRLVKALSEFGERLNERTVALLYYAGHALQLRDRNFLVPVDAEIHNED